MSHPLLAALMNPGIAGMLCLLALCVWMFFHPKDEHAPKILLLIMASLFFGPISEWVMDAESSRFPLKFDYFLYLIDKGLDVSAFSLARILTDWQRSVLFVIYQSLGYVMIAWYVVKLKSRDCRSGGLLISYLVTYFTGPVLYLIVPARGPRHAFGSLFPMGNPDVSPVLVPLSGWPNAMPSLHVSTALLFVLFAGKSRILRSLAWLYLAGTIAATLAFEHYVIDLVVAVPFACFAALAGEDKIQKALANLALVLAWLVTIRFGTPALVAYPAVLRILAIATIGVAGFSAMSRRKSRSAVVLEPLPAESESASRLPAQLCTRSHSQ
jgi:hypothetical protein